MGWPGPMTHRQGRAWVAWINLQAGPAKEPDGPEPELTVEQAAKASKARWAARKRRATT